MIEHLPDLVNENTALVRRGRWATFTMLLGIGKQNWLITIQEGRVTDCKRENIRVSSSDFALIGTEDGWQKFWQQMPPPMHHDLHALIRAGKLRLEGNIDLLLGNMLYIKIMLETLRGKV